MPCGGWLQASTTRVDAHSPLSHGALALDPSSKAYSNRGQLSSVELRSVPIRTDTLRTSVHRQRSLSRPAEELAHEGVLRGEHPLGVARLHDPALPQDRDVFADLARRGDVVGHDDVGALVDLVHLLDQVA